MDNPGADGTKNCVTGSLALAPGRTGTLKVTLKRASDGKLGGKLSGLRGYPVTPGGPVTVDPKNIEGSNGYWGKFPDVFDASFEAGLRRSMAGRKGRSAGDPWCLGYFSDNDQDYVLGAVRHPQFVGTHWFQWKDEPTTGRVYDEENYQIGFVDIADTPYRETIEASREVGRRLYRDRLEDASTGRSRRQKRVFAWPLRHRGRCGREFAVTGQAQKVNPQKVAAEVCEPAALRKQNAHGAHADEQGAFQPHARHRENEGGIAEP